MVGKYVLKAVDGDAIVEQVVGGAVGACAPQMAFTPLVNHRPLLLPLLIYIN